jgi:hypothetical protein
LKAFREGHLNLAKHESQKAAILPSENGTTGSNLSRLLIALRVTFHKKFTCYAQEIHLTCLMTLHIVIIHRKKLLNFITAGEDHSKQAQR